MAESKVMVPGFYGEYSNAFFDFLKTWVKSSSKRNVSPTDWRVWLPRAFYLNWSDPNTLQKSMMDPTIWLPMAFYPQEEIERVMKVVNVAGDYVAGDKAGDTFKDINDAIIMNKSNLKNQ
jgi:hypothetical protein